MISCMCPFGVSFVVLDIVYFEMSLPATGQKLMSSVRRAVLIGFSTAHYLIPICRLEVDAEHVY